MSLHDDIMNISIDYSDWRATKETTAYRIGHRDARHAAAKLAIEADNRIEELETRLRKVSLKAVRYEFLCNNADRYHFDLSESQESIDAQIDSKIAAENNL